MENKQNYQKLLFETIDKIKSNGKKPSLLLHACCGPCSTECLTVLNDYFNITVLFFNPNIHPKEEFDKRYTELKKFIELKNKESENQIKVIDTKYEPNEYFEKVRGLENEKEGGKRCEKCFELRLEQTAILAKEKNFDYFSTTLTVSPYKNSQILNEIGKKMAEKHKISYLFSDFKKNNGYKNSIEYSKKYNLYRQDYCGCIYSLNERNEYLKHKNSES